MVVWPRVVTYPPVDRLIRIAGAFCAELPYPPVFAMFGVEEFDNLIERVAVCALGIRLRGS